MSVKQARESRTPDRVEETGVGPAAAATTQAAESSATSPKVRGTNGRFLPGNPGGPGNPFARQAAQLRAALVHRVKNEDMESIADELVLKATYGNLAATKLLFQYVLGKPAEPVNPDTLDIQEFKEVYAPRGEIIKDGAKLVQGLPPYELDEEAKALLARHAAPSTIGGNGGNRPVEAGTPPSTTGGNRGDRPAEAGPRPSTIGEIGPTCKQPPPPAATDATTDHADFTDESSCRQPPRPAARGAKQPPLPHAERRTKNGMERDRSKKDGRPPSTNGSPTTHRREGDDPNGDGRRRCA
jgi:hypothetical protein